jgi:hypothetical protein
MDTGISAGVVEKSAELTLTTLQVASAIGPLSGELSTDRIKVSFEVTPKFSGAYHIIEYSSILDGTDHFITRDYVNNPSVVQQKYIASHTFIGDEIAAIYSHLPKESSVWNLKVTLITYRDSGKQYEVGRASRTVKWKLQPNYVPSMDMRLSPVTDYESINDIYVKGLSKVKATFTNEAAQNGATVKSYKLTVAGKEYGDPYISDILTVPGSVKVVGTITDSRGFSRSYTQTINVIDYEKPTLDLVSCDSSYLTGNITYKYTPANNVFYSRCVVALNLGGNYTQIKEILLGVKTAGQKTETLTLSQSELETIYAKLPNDTEGTLRLTLRTYRDAEYSEAVGDATYKEITLSIPDDDTTKPTATLTVSPETSLETPFNTFYIKGITRVTANLEGGAGKYGATPKSYSVSIGAQKGTPPLTSEYLITTGDVTITGTITDSRGYSRTYTTKINVIDYAAPRILPVTGESSVIAARCNAEGAIDENGTYLLIAAKRNYSKVILDDVQKNFCAIQYRIKAEGGSFSDWVEILPRNSASDEVITGAVDGVSLATTSTYVVQVRAVDDIGGKATTQIFVSTQKVYMHRAGSINSLGIGKYVEEENTVDIAEDMTTIFRGEVQFKSEEWVELPLGTNVTASTVDSGRWGGTGVFYRVCAGGNHIYVAFNVSFTTSDSTVRAESSTIPYPPTYDVYALCPVGFSDGTRGIATVSISPKGRVNIYAVHKLPGATLSTGETVNWIDGYIDYWT